MSAPSCWYAPPTPCTRGTRLGACRRQQHAVGRCQHERVVAGPVDRAEALVLHLSTGPRSTTPPAGRLLLQWEWKRLLGRLALSQGVHVGSATRFPTMKSCSSSAGSGRSATFSRSKANVGLKPAQQWLSVGKARSETTARARAKPVLAIESRCECRRANLVSRRSCPRLATIGEPTPTTAGGRACPSWSSNSGASSRRPEFPAERPLKRPGHSPAIRRTFGDCSSTAASS